MKTQKIFIEELQNGDYFFFEGGNQMYLVLNITYQKQGWYFIKYQSTRNQRQYTKRIIGGYYQIDLCI